MEKCHAGAPLVGAILEECHAGASLTGASQCHAATPLVAVHLQAHKSLLGSNLEVLSPKGSLDPSCVTIHCSLAKHTSIPARKFLTSLPPLPTSAPQPPGAIMWQVTIDAEEGTIVVRRAVRLRARFRIGHHEHGGPAQNSGGFSPSRVSFTSNCVEFHLPFWRAELTVGVPFWSAYVWSTTRHVWSVNVEVSLLETYCWSTFVGVLLLESQ